jgi:hypothetical protein
MKRFRAVLEARAGGGHMVALPFDARETFGKVRAPVRVTVNRHTFTTTTMRYGGVDYLGLNRGVREAAGVAVGDRLSVGVELDTTPRTVEVPGELSRALRAAPDAREAFEGLSVTHRREYARWIEEAKREKTRMRRVERAVEMLREGARTPAATRR